MERLTSKYSTILIATKGRTRVFHSVEDVPAKLREKLLETTQGSNSATILIADQGGREEILNAMRRAEPEGYARLLAALKKSAREAAHRGPKWMVFLPLAGRAILVASLGYVLWVLATLR